MDKDNKRVEEPLENYGEPLSFEKVWLMFQETDKQFKETDKKFQETDKQFKETDKKFQETDKKLNKLEQLFTSQWGKLIESLVQGDLINVLGKWGISVTDTSERRKGNKNGENFEFDIIAHNGNEIVVVEVKTTLRPDDVADFQETMKKAKVYLPEYANKTIYAAMAFLTADGHADRMAEKKGFFIIRATGNSAAIVNQKDFKPRIF
ncbi:MAG: YraN family protein [Chlorobi bacterium]|nr:YraN family protein [Chlorobiota bacterium]